MIEKNLYRSITSIVNDVNIDVLEYMQMFTYGLEGTTTKKAKDLITYQVITKKAKSYGKNYLEKIGSVYQRFFETTYYCQTIIDCYGENAEELMNKIIRVLGNDLNCFADNNLTIVNYETVKNLSFLENGTYKKRYSIEVIFKYIDKFTNENSENIVKDIEFEIEVN